MGRFGQLWASILKNDFKVSVYDALPERAKIASELGVDFVSLSDALANDVIFYCVPISIFEQTLVSHLPILAKLPGEKTLIDVLSVKLHPMEVFEKHLPAGYNVILTHPMFGPDSVQLNGLVGQPIVMDRFKASNETFEFWKNYFKKKQLQVIEMSADEHDRLAAQSQVLPTL